MCAWCAAATEDTFAVCWQPRKAFLQWDCKKVTQTVYGWPRDGAYRMSLCHRGFLEDCLNLFVVELFIERLQTTSVTQIFNLLTFESVFHINDKLLQNNYSTLRESWVTFKKILRIKKKRKMKNPFIEPALLIWMRHVKHQPDDISLIRNQLLLTGQTNIHTNYIIK